MGSECVRGLENLGPHVEVTSRRRGDCGRVEVVSAQVQVTMGKMWNGKIWEMFQECWRMVCGGVGVERL